MAAVRHLLLPFKAGPIKSHLSSEHANSSSASTTLHHFTSKAMYGCWLPAAVVLADRAVKAHGLFSGAFKVAMHGASELDMSNAQHKITTVKKLVPLLQLSNCHTINRQQTDILKCARVTRLWHWIGNMSRFTQQPCKAHMYNA